MSKDLTIKPQNLFLSKSKASSTEIESLKVGDSVKILMAEKEYMWVEVVEINNSYPKTFKGKVDNDPTTLENVKFGDAVFFEDENIVEILK